MKYKNGHFLVAILIFIYMKIVIKKLLKEALFNKESEEQMTLLNNFITFVSKKLNLSNPKIILKYDRKQLVTTAAYGNNKVLVYAKERALVDIMRSIAHELVHMKQDAEGKLKDEEHDQNNAAGSPIENEANFKAGEYIRQFGKLHPEIYE